jgi:surface polysaccharide O-acyltransferase-like enzyme
MSAGLGEPNAARVSADVAPDAAVTRAAEAETARAAQVAAAPEARRTGSQRLANVERLRLVAMFEIVAFHVSQDRLPLIAGLGLPSFLLLNNAFNCTLSERMGTRAFLRTKVTKLLVPWLVWSLVYALVIVLEKLRHDESIREAFTPWMLVGGTYIHLWFVPFALAGGVFAAALQARTQKVSHPRMVAILLALGTAWVLGGAWIMAREDVRWPALQWLFASPSPILGFALGRVILARDQRLLAVVCALSVVAGVLAELGAFGLGLHRIVPRYAVSMAVVSLALLWPGRPDAWSQKLTPLLFGVYLTHPLIVRTYMATHLPTFGVTLQTLLVFSASVVLVLILQRTPLRRLV